MITDIPMTDIPTKEIVELLPDGKQVTRTIIDIRPRQAQMMRLRYGGNVIFDDARLTELENKIDNMVQCQHAASVAANLDNCTDHAQVAKAEGDNNAMAQHRMRVCIGHNADGSPVIKQVGAKSETELADKIVATVLQSERRSEFIPPLQPIVTTDIPTFGQYAADWLATYKTGKLKPTTLKGYNVMLNAHLYPAWAETPLNKIDAKSIQQFMDERKSLSKKYLRELRNCLSQILESARQDKLIADNPAKDNRLKNPSSIVTERQALSAEHLRSIIASLHLLDDDPKAQIYLALVIYTGARKGEILGLRWEDVDLANNVIHIRRNVTTTSNQPIIGTPKTKAGYRDIPILQGLLDYLKGGDPTHYVVGGRDTPITGCEHTRMMQRIKAKIDLHGATSHCFRHTFGTLLNDVGANVKTIQAILGQSDFKTTADRYVHPRQEREIEAANMVNDMLSSANT